MHVILMTQTGLFISQRNNNNNNKNKPTMLFVVRAIKWYVRWVLYVAFACKEKSELIKPIIKQIQFIYSISVCCCGFYRMGSSSSFGVCTASPHCASACLEVVRHSRINSSLNLSKWKYSTKLTRARVRFLIYRSFLMIKCCALRSSVRLVWRKM